MILETVTMDKNLICSQRIQFFLLHSLLYLQPISFVCLLQLFTLQSTIIALLSTNSSQVCCLFRFLLCTSSLHVLLTKYNLLSCEIINNQNLTKANYNRFIEFRNSLITFECWPSLGFLHATVSEAQPNQSTFPAMFVPNQQVFFT